MASRRIKRNRRNATTLRGLQRRVEDAEFDKVDDQRQSAKVRYALPGLLGLCTLSFASGALGLRGIESRSEQLYGKARRDLGLPDERIADNTVAAVFPNVEPEQV